MLSRVPKPCLSSRWLARVKSLRRLTTVSKAAKTLNVLVVDAYAPASRQGSYQLCELFLSRVNRFRDFNLPMAGDLYTQMLQKVAPRGVEVETTIVYPADDSYTAPDVTEYDGLAFSGSSYSVYEDVPGVTRQIELTHECFDKQVPCFGSCWGLQILAYAAGASVELNPRGREYGIGRKISLTPEGRGHPLFEGKKSTFDAFISHSDEVVHMPRNIVNLAGNDHSRVQALALSINNCEHWAVQYHPEYSLGYISQMTVSRTERLMKMGFFQSEEDLRTFSQDLATIHEDSSRFDLKWKYGIDEDVMNPDLMLIEPKNWIRRLLSLSR